MTPERWEQIQRMFDAAMAFDPPRRESFLIEASAGDDVLLREVKALLEHTSDDDSLLEEPAVEFVASAWPGRWRPSRMHAGRPHAVAVSIALAAGWTV